MAAKNFYLDIRGRWRHFLYVPIKCHNQKLTFNCCGWLVILLGLIMNDHYEGRVTVNLR